MAGHSQFANIKHRKGAQDAKRSKLFTKIAREIIIATQLGQPDPNFNARLRNAIAAAKKAGLPKDRIENSIKKGSGELAGESYVELKYEGYGPGGIALIIEVQTDNRNRTASDVRSLLTKANGSLGESGSVGFMFEKVGQVSFPAAIAGGEAMFEAALEAGASNCESGSEFHEITCEAADLNAVKEALMAKFGEPEEAKLVWKPKDPMVVDDQTKAQAILDLIESLEDLDDVQAVYANMVIDAEIAKNLSS